MKAIFKKKKTSDLILTLVRDDESVTWTKIRPGLEYHDLAHYVVEKNMAWDEAFFGLINRGIDIGDFESRVQEKKRQAIDSISIEALQAEHIVNLMATEFLYASNVGFIKELKKILMQSELSYPDKLDEDVLSSIKEEYFHLIKRMNMLKPGETLELNFECRS